MHPTFAIMAMLTRFPGVVPLQTTDCRFILGNNLHLRNLIPIAITIIMQQAKKDQPYLDNYYQIGIQGEAGAAWGGGAVSFED